MLQSISIALHLLSAVVWVGGMFFAYVVLRPTTVGLLEPPVRLAVWSEVFRRFFPWVWLAILILVTTGNVMIFGVFGGMKQAGLHIHIMNGIAWVMIFLFLYLNLGPLKGLRVSIADQNWGIAAEFLARIRRIIAINLSLGLAVIVIAGAGKTLI